MTADTIHVYILHLEDDGSPDKHRSYIRLPPPINPYVLRLSIAAGSTASANGVVHTNFPVDGSEFKRDKYHKQPLPNTFSKPITVDFYIKHSGVFTYYIEYDDPTSSSPNCIKSTPGFFNVDPILAVPSRTPILDPDTFSIQPIGTGGKVLSHVTSLPLDGLVVQSVIAPWMGPMSEWKPHLDLIRDRGYNCIHFAPLQQCGLSNSPYSIFDQLLFADSLFPPDNIPKSPEERIECVSKMIHRMKDEWGILTIIDIVLNHTSSDSEWLHSHPEAGYNVLNSPHLTAAVELENALLKFSESLSDKGLPTEIKSEQDIGKITQAMRAQVLEPLKLWQFYVVDVASTKESFIKEWSSIKKITAQDPVSFESQTDEFVTKYFADHCLPKDWKNLGARYRAKVDIQRAVHFISKLLGMPPSEDSKLYAAEKLVHILNTINVPRYEMYNEDLSAIVNNLTGRIRYTRLDSNGPKEGPITKSSPLVEVYFTRLPLNEITKKHDPSALVLANNGWIWDANPLIDFASSDSRAYLRRDVISWGDCVKLRYGKGPEDSPYLWKRMLEYSRLLAKLFAGFRIDNCHSTPIHVGEAILDAAREVNHNLYVCAELFTGNEELDLYFTKRLGINSLIREAISGNNPKDQSSLLYRYGIRRPVGSMDQDCLDDLIEVQINNKTYSGIASPHQGSVPHAFMMDLTHDNVAPAQKRTAEDALPTGALVPYTAAAIGSNRGFDDLYPRYVDIRDKHMYSVETTVDSGIGLMKRILNHLHTEMALNSYTECYFSEEGEYIMAHRVNPSTNDGYLVVTHTAFQPGKDRGYVNPVRLYETKMKYIWGASLNITSGAPENKEMLEGFKSKLDPIKSFKMVEGNDNKGFYSELSIPENFPPGSIMIIATRNDHITTELSDFVIKDSKTAVSELDIVDLNILMYRSDGEERDATGGQLGAYNIPGLGPLTYCGLEGWLVHLRHIIRFNDLGHPLCDHLRNGIWAFDYLHERLEKQTEQRPRLASTAKWFKEKVDKIRDTVPPYLRPRFFAILVNCAYAAARQRAISLMSPLIRNGPIFTHNLAMCSVQMYGLVSSASLDPGKAVPSQAAGLPHFAAGWARVWGRDCAIASRMFITTGQFDAARQHILALASTLKHGLIPNLIDSIRTPRYNSRDSPWFFVQLVQDYVLYSPEGKSFLDVKLKLRFPADDTWIIWDDQKAYSRELRVKDVVVEILQRHAQGIHFREWNAGPNLDMQMRDEGFNIDIDVDWSTGFIHGGNAYNCGTWMDKNGESEKAGTKGLPGTSRDGAPVEITGLLKSTLRWCHELYQAGLLESNGVESKKRGFITYEDWGALIQENFEKYYYVPELNEEVSYYVDSSLIARRSIYKDVFGSGSGRERCDYQLRANFPIAMTVAPELFNKEHAKKALDIYAEALVKPLGVATLDPSDPDYRPNYYNSDDSNDFLTAKGRNYHQGPEWVWPLGYFLRAFFNFNRENKDDVGEKLMHKVHSFLKQHRQEIEQSPWRGLPELTNENGSYCHDSCRTQAWSASTILDVLDDIYRAENAS